jgi:hypothetical protein
VRTGLDSWRRICSRMLRTPLEFLNREELSSTSKEEPHSKLINSWHNSRRPPILTPSMYIASSVGPQLALALAPLPSSFFRSPARVSNTAPKNKAQKSAPSLPSVPPNPYSTTLVRTRSSFKIPIQYRIKYIFDRTWNNLAIQRNKLYTLQ